MSKQLKIINKRKKKVYCSKGSLCNTNLLTQYFIHLPHVLSTFD